MYTHGHAAANNGDAVADLFHFVQFMGNENNGIAIIFQIFQFFKQFCGFLRSQNCGGLIQDQDLGTAEQRLQDLHLLLLADGQITDLLVGVNVQVVLLTDLLNLLSGILGVDKDTLSGFNAHDHILGHSQRGYQHEMLMHHTDAQIDCHLGRCDIYLITIDKNLP